MYEKLRDALAFDTKIKPYYLIRDYVVDEDAILTLTEFNMICSLIESVDESSEGMPYISDAVMFFVRNKVMMEYELFTVWLKSVVHIYPYGGVEFNIQRLIYYSERFGLNVYDLIDYINSFS